VIKASVAKIAPNVQLALLEKMELLAIATVLVIGEDVSAIKVTAVAPVDWQQCVLAMEHVTIVVVASKDAAIATLAPLESLVS